MAHKTKTTHDLRTQPRVVAITKKIIEELGVGNNQAPPGGKLYYENCNGDLFILGGPDHPIDVGDLLALVHSIKDNG